MFKEEEIKSNTALPFNEQVHARLTGHYYQRELDGFS